MDDTYVFVPPIKSQGIKTKLVPWIRHLIPGDFEGRWIEPFMGTGVVGFNVHSSTALMSDTNPHLVDFYSSVASGEISPRMVREFLQREGALLSERGESHYYEIRKRFNLEHDPLDFLFLNRAGFNGMIRFNRKGGFNIPFCRKPDRFSPAYITRIVNQVSATREITSHGNFAFRQQHFVEAIGEARSGDIIYCDPPYIARHVDYFNGWTESDEHTLHNLLHETPASFILSTWAGNEHRQNPYLTSLWSDFVVETREHFYHVGANLENRKPMTEALVHSRDLTLSDSGPIPESDEQLALL